MSNRCQIDTQPARKVVQGSLDLESLIRALGVSEAEFGELLAPYRPNGLKGIAYTRASVNAWKSGKHPMNEQVRETIATMIRAYTAIGTDGLIRARIQVGARSIRAQALRPCKICGTEFVMERSNQTKCKRHRSK